MRERHRPLATLALTLAALSTLGAAAPAAAQDAAPAPWRLTLEVQPVGALRPHPDSAMPPVTVAAPCEALIARGGAVAVDLAVAERPEWADASVEPGRVTLASNGCVRGEATARAHLRLRITQDAPTGVRSAITVAAKAPGFAEARGATHVVPAFRGRVDVRALTAAVAPEGAEAQFPVTVANPTNGPVEVTMRVAEAFPGANAQVPAPFTVPSRAHGAADNARTVHVTVTAPERSGYTWAHERVVVELAAAHAHGGEPAGGDTLLLVVATDGMYVSGGAVAGGLTLLAAAGGAGAIAWRRRDALRGHFRKR